MANQATASNALQPERLMRARALSLCATAALALAFACAPQVTAQTAAGAKGTAAQKPSVAERPVESSPGEGSAAVRERRTQAGKEGPAAKGVVGAAKNADATKSEAATGSEAATKKGEPVVESASPANSEDEAKGEQGAADAAAVETESPAPEGADGLRAKLKEAKTDAERARLRRELADQLAAEGHQGEAVAELRAMLGDERFDPAGFYNVGNALARLNESNAAVEAYRKAIDQRHGNYSRALHNLGVVLVRLGRWEEALEALRTALRLEGGRYPEASYNLGRLHALRGEAGLAIDAWTRALAKQPEHTDTAIALAHALAEDGDPEQGLAVLDAFTKRFSRRGTSAPRSVEIARGEIVAARNLPEVAAGAERAGESAPGSRRGGAGATPPLGARTVDQQTYDMLGRARDAREGGRHEEAVALYRRVIERRGGYFPPANLELGYSLSSLRRDPEATATLELVASKEGGRYPVAFYHLGRLYERGGEIARARDAFARAVALYGDDNPQILIDLSRVREKEGDLRGAAEAMETYVSATSRLGGTPEWAHEHLAKLRQKTAAANPQKQ